MHIYNVPAQLDREDKIFGGRISLRQFIYLVVGVGIGAVMFLSLYRTSIETAIFVWALCGGLGCVLAFYKVKEVDIDRYMVMLLRFRLIRKKYPFMGGGRQ